MTSRTRARPLARPQTELVAALLALLRCGLLLSTLTFMQAKGFAPHINTAQVSRDLQFCSASRKSESRHGRRESRWVARLSDRQGNTYVLAVGPTILISFGTHAIYYAKNIVAASAGTSTVTVRFGDAAPLVDIRVAKYSGVDMTNPFDGGVGATRTSGITPDSGPPAVSNTNDLLVAGDCTETLTTIAGAGYTARITTAPVSRFLEDRVATTAGTYTTTTAQGARCLRAIRSIVA